MSLDIYTSKQDKLCSIKVDSISATIADLKVQISKKTHIPLPRLSLRLEPGGKSLADVMPLGVLAHSIGKIYVSDLGRQINWRNAYLLEYLGPLFIYGLIYFKPSLMYSTKAMEKQQYDKKHNLKPFILWSIHFAKRILETLFVHRFSRPLMPLRNMLKNCAYYWGFAAIIGYHVNHPLYTPIHNEIASALGVVIFVICELGNASTHLVLRDLRPPGTKKRGIPFPNLNPLTFLFAYVSCPNYTYEFGAWIGYSLTVNSIHFVLFMFIGFVQMTIWAMEKHRRYVSEFPEYPKNRRVILPFLV